MCVCVRASVRQRGKLNESIENMVAYYNILSHLTFQFFHILGNDIKEVFSLSVDCKISFGTVSRGVTHKSQASNTLLL